LKLLVAERQNSASDQAIARRFALRDVGDWQSQPTNAALLAVAILANTRPELRESCGNFVQSG